MKLILIIILQCQHISEYYDNPSLRMIGVGVEPGREEPLPFNGCRE